MSTIPDKPDGNRDTLTIRELNITIESPTEGETSQWKMPGEDGTMPPELMDELLNTSNRHLIKRIWNSWMDTLFNHVYNPTPIFNTKEKTLQSHGDITAHIVKKRTFGRSQKTVLDRSQAFSEKMDKIGKIIALQHAITSDKTPREVCQDVPYNFQPFDVMRIRELSEQHQFVWVNDIDSHWTKRTPLGQSEINGMLYIMYTITDDKVIPKYIGISQRDSIDGDQLNWNFQNVRRDSVFGRWGYGSSQHLGELSKAVFADEYEESPKPKYERWKNDLFVGQSAVLKKQLYINLLPWFIDDLHIAERNLIKLAEFLYGNQLLNVEFTDL